MRKGERVALYEGVMGGRLIGLDGRGLGVGCVVKRSITRA